MSDPNLRRRGWIAVGCIAGILLAWILLTPPGAGPDEPDHLVRSGAVVRGELGGIDRDDEGYEYYELPDSYAVPDHRCYSFIANRSVSADCVRPYDYTGDTVSLGSRADEYPIWGHLTYGVATLLPGLPDVWWARLGGALVVGALLVGAWRASTTALSRSALLLALTPMAWGSFAVVNPSAFAIAGGIAMWVGLWAIGEISNRANPYWLFVAGTAALVLPRRDGIVWASLIVAAVIVISGRRLLVFWHRIDRRAQRTLAVIAVGPIVYAVMEPKLLTIGALLAPVLILIADHIVQRWHRCRSARERATLAALCVGGGLIAVVAAASLRPGGWDSGLASLIFIHSDAHLQQAMGVLGWLDLYLPYPVYLAIIVSLGMLAGLAVVYRPMLAVAAAGILGTDIIVSWVLEMLSGADYGQYWQGRYSLPLLVGIPIVLAAAPDSSPLAVEASRRAARTVSFLALAGTNVAAWAAARRWGVGVDGSLFPWNWATEHSDMPPIVALLLIAGATSGLLWLTWTSPITGRDDHALLLGDVRDRS